MISLQNITHHYSQTTDKYAALDDFSLDFKERSITAIIGRSGAGKSTLLKILNLSLAPDQGQIIWQGQRVNSQDIAQLKKLRQQMAMVFQDFALLQQRTVQQNVALPLCWRGKTAAQANLQAKICLEQMGLADFVDKYPDELSGGQKQRVGIARALATEPTLLLCDEPTSALDVAATADILALLKQIQSERNITIVLVTHELSVVKRAAHEVAVLDQGQLIESGPVLDVLLQPSHVRTKAWLRRESEDQPPPWQTMVKQDNARWFRLLFLGIATEESLLIEIYKQFKVTANIFESHIEYIDDAMVGECICQWHGKADNFDKALAYLRDHQVLVEEVNHVAD